MSPKYGKNRRTLLAAFGLAAILVPGTLYFVSNLPFKAEPEAVGLQSEPPVREPGNVAEEEKPETTKLETTKPEERIEAPELLDTRKLYAEVSGIARSHDGEYGVAIYDPESNRGVLYNGEEVYDAASIGKLPVMAALYREAAAGKLDLDEEIEIQYPDVQSYGTGVLHVRPVGTELTLEECAYHLMKDSDNTAWAMLYRRLGIDRVSDELKPLGAEDSDYDPYGRLYTDASDTLEILKKIRNPDYTTPKLSEEMLAMMTDTAFEGRIPEPLPNDEDIRVAHKIGSNGNTFGDAGIIFYEDPSGEARHYYVIVLAKETTGSEATDAMRKVSLAAYRAIV